MRNFDKLLLVPAAVAGLIGSAACHGGTERPSPVSALTEVHFIGAGKVAVAGHPNLAYYNAANFGQPIDNGFVKIGTNGFGQPLDGDFGVACIVDDTSLRVSTAVGTTSDNGEAPITGDVLARPTVITGAKNSGIPDC